MLPPEILLERLAARLTELDATPYQQTDTGYTDSWAESRNPFTPDGGSGRRHLSFLVVIEVSNHSSSDEGETGRQIRAVSQVAVLFEYSLRGDAQSEDYRLAHRAARDVVAAVNDEGSWGYGEAEVEPRILSQSQPSRDGLFVRMRTVFSITHEYEV